jgi:MFS family permease
MAAAKSDGGATGHSPAERQRTCANRTMRMQLACEIAPRYRIMSSLLLSGTLTFAAIAVGGIGSVLAGLWADRLGRENVAIASMALSGACALTLGWLLSASPWLVVGIALIWGFAVVADSAQFSALVTEVAPPHAVGTALTLQTSLGFLLTAATIWLTFAVQHLLGWGPAFAMLALGPAVGIVQMARLRRIRLPARSGTGPS